MDKKNLTKINIVELDALKIDPLKTTPLAVQLPQYLIDKLEAFARLTGHVRALRGRVGVIGNLSYALGESYDFLFAHLSLYQQERSDRQNVDSKSVQISIQVPQDMKDKLETFARLLGHISKRGKGEGEGDTGNVSWASVESALFLFAHPDLYQQEKGEQLIEAMEQ